MRRKIVAGNWKLNGSKDLVNSLVDAVRPELASLDNGVEAVIVPPFLYVGDVIKRAGGDLAVGVQNVAYVESGAFTGETAAAMAKDCGCDYALVGHSERRQLFGETDEQVAAKVGMTLDAGLNAIICVGETLDQREAGDAEAVVRDQVRRAVANVSPEQWQQVVIAYEPVWAIGTGKTATADDAQAMHASIRSLLASVGAPADELPLLYGGSVKADNAAALFAQADVDGGLVGGSSLNAEEFVSICRAVPARR